MMDGAIEGCYVHWGLVRSPCKYAQHVLLFNDILGRPIAKLTLEHKCGFYHYILSNK